MKSALAIDAAAPGAAPDAERLIDRGLEVLEVSSSGLAERYAQGRTPHAGQVWWARRPHAAMRALVFATLCPSQSPEATAVLVSLANGRGDLGALYGQAKAHIAGAPRVLDMFGGGGTIAHEAAALGAEAHSLDYNSLASFLQTVNLPWSRDAFASLGKRQTLELMAATGRAVIDRAGARVDGLFPARVSGQAGREPMVYFWSYAYRCRACDYQFSLSKRRWLSKKAGRQQRLAFEDGAEGQTVTLGLAETDDQQGPWIGRRGLAACPRCRAVTDKIHLDDCQDTLLAVCVKDGARKAFAAVPADRLGDFQPAEAAIAAVIDGLWAELAASPPTSEFPQWSGIVNPAGYGLDTHAKIFNRRQQASTLAVSAELLSAYRQLTDRHGVEVARYVVGSLSALIDQLVDWNSRLSMWIPQNEQVGRGFCGPGISMLWDYAESDSFSGGPANLNDKLRRIVNAAQAIPAFDRRPVVVNGMAQALPYPDKHFDAIVTDPPYYDNIFYNVLADSFHAWKRPLLRHVHPDLFAAEKTSEAGELVASRQRQGSSEAAHAWYCDQFGAALAEAARVLKPRGLFALVYGHSALLGWQAILTTYRDSGLAVESVQPLAIERRARPRAMTSEAVNTCVVIVARKRPRALRRMTLEAFLDEAVPLAAASASELRGAGWAEADIGMACFAKAVGRLAMIAPFAGVSDIEALRWTAARIALLIPGFKMAERGAI